MTPRLLLSLAVVLVLLAGCTIRHPIEIDISSQYPFACVDELGEPLIERAVVAERDVLFVFDFISAPTYPSCRVASILAECEGSGCEALVPHRACVRIPWSRIVELAARHPIHGGSDLIESAIPLGGDAPDGPVIVRMVAQVAPVDPLEDPCALEPDGSLRRFDPALLMGCGYSCPTVLDAEPTQVEIDLDPALNGATCGLDVISVCADLGIR